MEELNTILDAILEVYNISSNNDVRHEQASKLWTKYYQLSSKLGQVSDRAYYNYLMLESESYCIDQAPIRKNIDLEKVKESAKKLQGMSEGSGEALTEEEAVCLLDWTVENTRRNLENGLCINLAKNSLNGFCDVAQISSLTPLEKLGVSVTKNSAQHTFLYPFTHYFGTVTFPIEKDGIVGPKSYLVDVTYRQFFSTVRCNYGRYFTEEENYHIMTAPDPGYFVTDKGFARELLGHGYVELTDANAKKYGEAFTKASIPYKELNNFSDSTNNYRQLFFERQDSDYALSDNSLEGFNLDVPNISHHK